MDESRRERKKRQARRQLADTAIRLFAEQGYEHTTVAQIASAADVATKTFFNHFRGKEDVLFEESRHSSAVALEVIADRYPGESIPELLARTYDAMLADYHAQDAGRGDPELMKLRPRLIMTVPSLQARALQEVFEIQREISAALVKAYPEELDPISAAAVVGSLVGATQGAALTSLELGESESQFWESMRRGTDIALHGLHGPRTQRQGSGD